MSIYRPEDFGRKYTQPKNQKKAFRPGIIIDPDRAKKGTLKKDFFDFNRLKTKRNGKKMISLVQQKDGGGTPYVTIGGKRRYFRPKPNSNSSSQPITMNKNFSPKKREDFLTTPNSKATRVTLQKSGQQNKSQRKVRDDDLYEAMWRRVNKRKAV